MFPDSNSRSAALFERAREVMPGGNSRHSVALRPYPIYAASGEGCQVTDADGRDYVDLINNMSANIHGHRHPVIMDAVSRQADRLVSAGMPTEAEIELAEVMVARVPSVDSIRFANSGTEALMFAVRAARAFTGRDLIAKIEGGYHGSYDALDVSNRPGPDAWGPADAPATVREGEGMTVGAVADTLVLPVNAVEPARHILRANAERLAAVVIDPLVSRLGFLPLSGEFLAMIAEETRAAGALLVYDEVFSFRLGLAGAQGAVGARPDLSTFGKIIGGGFPIGAVGGRRDVMDVFDHLAGRNPRVEHSGTFNANPISAVAGAAALGLLDQPAFDRLDRLGEGLRVGFHEIFRRLGIPGQMTGRGSLTALLPHDEPYTDYRSFAAALSKPGVGSMLAALNRGLINRGVLPVFPAAFILSTPMSDDIIDQVLTAGEAALQEAADALATRAA